MLPSNDLGHGASTAWRIGSDPADDDDLNTMEDRGLNQVAQVAGATVRRGDGAHARRRLRQRFRK